MVPWLLTAALAAAPALGQPAPRPAPPARPSAPAPAAGEHPPLLPTREASVLYRMAGTGRPVTEVRVTTLPNGGPMRIDMPDLTYMLVDQAAKRMSLVAPNDQMVMEVPYDGGLQEVFLLDSRMKFARRGPETVAGTRCTVWDATLEPNHGLVCVTDDGVVLRSLIQDAQGRRSVIDAVSVSYAPAPASDFQEPAGYDHMAAPTQ